MKITDIQWKPINSLHSISNTGLIRDCNGDIVQQKLGRRNTLGVKEPVSRLVALAFIDNPENKPNVIHLDGNQRNNAFDNLQWATREETDAHMVAVRKANGYVHTMRSKPVVAISNYGNTLIFPSIKECARQLGIHKRCIQDDLKYNIRQCANWRFNYAS